MSLQIIKYVEWSGAESHQWTEWTQRIMVLVRIQFRKLVHAVQTDCTLCAYGTLTRPLSSLVNTTCILVNDCLCTTVHSLTTICLSTCVSAYLLICSSTVSVYIVESRAPLILMRWSPGTYVSCAAAPGRPIWFRVSCHADLHAVVLTHKSRHPGVDVLPSYARGDASYLMPGIDNRSPVFRQFLNSLYQC